MNRIRIAVGNAIKNNNVLKVVAKSNGVFDIEDLADAITSIIEKDNALRYAIHHEVERDFHREDVVDRLLSENINIDEDTISLVTDRYEHNLYQDESSSLALDWAINDLIELDDIYGDDEEE